MYIAMGSDHAGFEMKQTIKDYLTSWGHQINDVGSFNSNPIDYPEIGAAVARAVVRGGYERGILICGSGEGMCIVANRFQGIRAVLAPTLKHAQLSRKHNNANILCLGGRLTSLKESCRIAEAFLKTAFEDGRHKRRIDQIEKISMGIVKQIYTYSRPNKHEYYLEIARAVCRRGTCLRRQYGAVIVNDDQIVSTGYAGAPRGIANCVDLGICLRQQLGIPPGQRYELCRSVHAEMNAIIHASRSQTLGAILYLIGLELATGELIERPEVCLLCQRVIINAGIANVIMQSHNMSIIQLDPKKWINQENQVVQKECVITERKHSFFLRSNED